MLINSFTFLFDYYFFFSAAFFITQNRIGHEYYKVTSLRRIVLAVMQQTNKKKDLEINRSQNNLKLVDTENLWLGNVA